jgi:hypothetical protein
MALPTAWIPIPPAAFPVPTRGLDHLADGPCLGSLSPIEGRGQPEERGPEKKDPNSHNVPEGEHPGLPLLPSSRFLVAYLGLLARGRRL